MDVIVATDPVHCAATMVEASWAWTDPIIQAGKHANDVPKPFYDSGSDGRQMPNELMRRWTSGNWREYSA